MKAARKPSSEREIALDETHAGATKSFKSGKLRLLMQEREGVASRLVELDYMIWALEEIYRKEPVKMRPSLFGTPVPQGSLTTEGGKAQP
ncbi:MAG TPA: hypothetical protein VK126_04270 [Nitrososphaerales archaeon]|nr:hypothetical protein [Nitrososphaerales archaeon]